MKYFTKTVTLSRRVVGHSARWEQVECRVDLAFDEERLFLELGQRALGNKSRRTKEIGGLVEAEVHIVGGA